MANAPVFAVTPKLYVGQVTVANTNRDGTGTVVTLFTAGTNGEKVLEITVEATVTTTAGMVRIFISKDGGTTKRLYDEFPISAVTVAANTVAARVVKTYDNLNLEANDILYAATNNAEAMNVFVATAQY